MRNFFYGVFGLGMCVMLVLTLLQGFMVLYRQDFTSVEQTGQTVARITIVAFLLWIASDFLHNKNISP